jgi:hypothetical protein
MYKGCTASISIPTNTTTIAKESLIVYKPQKKENQTKGSGKEM